MIFRARHYATGELVDVQCEADRIVAVGTPSEAVPDRDGGWVAPAFFDLQINGCDGISFNSPKLRVEDVWHVVQVCRRHGISELLPTLITNSFDAIAHGFATLTRARDTDAELGRAIPGFHLEGPYISAEDGPRGAHPKSHVRAPNWDEFSRWQDVAEGRIRLVTLAPEHDKALPFIEKLTAANVVVAIGHTAASASRIRDAISAGAKLSTHLGNGSHAELPRHDNYLWEQLASDQLWASLICDGHHLPPALIKVMLRVKTPARAILTCDAGSLAGLPPGRYSDWGGEFEVLSDGRIVVPGTPYLAGSGSFTDQCVAHLLKLGLATLPDAIDMASARPRELLGQPPSRLQAGDPADLILFEWNESGKFQLAFVAGAESSKPR
jgi:N-acetylglucosamine-6-phosphate deacetylase